MVNHSSARLFGFLASFHLALFPLFTPLALADSTILSDGKYEVNIEPERDWIEHIAIEDLHFSKDSRKVDYLLVSRQSMMDEQGELQTYRRFVSKPLTRAGLDTEATVSISYRPDYQRLVVHRAEVHRNGETRNLLDDADVRFIQDEPSANSKIYSENLTLTMTPQDFRVGDLLDVSYSIVGQNPIYGSTFFAGNQSAWNTPVGTLQLRYLTPRDRKLYTRAYNNSRSLQRSVSGDWQTYSLTDHNIASVDLENDYPSSEFPFPWVQISEFKDWRKLSKWFNKLFDIDASSSQVFRDLVAELKAESSNKQEFLLKALDFVQEDITYVSLSIGENSHKPRHPDTVLNSRFGDCKDKALLLVALLRSQGIKAEPALVSDSSRGNIVDYLPTPGTFDHAIVHVELGRKDYWYDATRTYQEGDLEHLVNADFGVALRLDKSGNKLQSMVLPDVQKNRFKIAEKFELGNLVDAPIVRYSTVLSGASAESYRSYLENTSKSEVARNLRNYYADYYQGAETYSPYEYTDDKIRNELTIIESYQLPGFFTADSEVSLSASFYHVGIWDRLAFPDHADRKTSYEPSSPIEIEYSIAVTFLDESGFNLSPASQKFSTQGLHYESSSYGETGFYEMQATLSMTSESVSPNQLPEYISTMQSIKEDSYYSLTFAIPKAQLAKTDLDNLLVKLKQLSGADKDL